MDRVDAVIYAQIHFFVVIATWKGTAHSMRDLVATIPMTVTIMKMFFLTTIVAIMRLCRIRHRHLHLHRHPYHKPPIVSRPCLASLIPVLISFPGMIMKMIMRHRRRLPLTLHRIQRICLV